MALPGSQPAYRQAPAYYNPVPAYSNPEDEVEIVEENPVFQSTRARFLGAFRNAIKSTLPEGRDGNKGTHRREIIASLDHVIHDLEQQKAAKGAAESLSPDDFADDFGAMHNAFAPNPVVPSEKKKDAAKSLSLDDFVDLGKENVLI